MLKFGILTATALIAASTVASADYYGNSTRNIDSQQHRQEQQIQQGVRSGEITRRERAALEAEQARIRDLERRAKADGRVDAREAAEIRRAQNEASRHIRQESTDNERRGSWYRRWW